MADAIILGDPGAGRLSYHQLAANSVEDAEILVMGSAQELADYLAENEMPSLLVADFGWLDILPHVLQEQISGRVDFSTIVIGSYESSLINKYKNDLNCVGSLRTESQFMPALPKTIKLFLEQKSNGICFVDFQDRIKEFQDKFLRGSNNKEVTKYNGSAFQLRFGHEANSDSQPKSPDLG